MLEQIHERLIYQRRTSVLAKWLAESVPDDAELLDVGCGDGAVMAKACAVRPDVRVRGLDVLIRPQTLIPVDLFDGRTLPVPDRSFDAVSFIDVLHHTDDPIVLLKEAARVARKCVLIKDHTLDGFVARSRLHFMDRVGNCRHGVRLPYNYWPELEWRKAFESLGWTVQSWKSALSLYPLPIELLLGRGLHFCARLAVAAQDGTKSGRS